MEQKKQLLTVILMVVLLFGLPVLGIVLPDQETSYAERRYLATFPKVSSAAVFKGTFMQEIETYLQDQFPLRETFRTINAMCSYALLQADVNGIYYHKGHLIKMEYPLDEKQVNLFVNKINTLVNKHMTDCNVFYSVIPDKNYFAAEESRHLQMDYDGLFAKLFEGIHSAEYIDITDTLSLSDYYRTDIHWKQENLYETARTLAETMGSAGFLTPKEAYTAHDLYPFSGVYLGQMSLPVKKEHLIYLTSAATEQTVVTSVEKEGEFPVYDASKISGTDGYDVFLHGAQAVLTLHCENAKMDRNLVIFRDSFGSSIAPYFTGAYKTVTLVDLRYLRSDFLTNYVSFPEGTDVLFLYSTTVINQAAILR